VEDKKTLTFWKKLKYSIFDFEKYQEMAAEKIGKTIVYIIILMVIFNIVTAGIYTYKAYGIVNETKKYISENIETIEFKNGKLTVIGTNNENKIEKEPDEKTAVKVIIDTNNISNETINEYVKKIESNTIGILVLNDRILLSNTLLTTPNEYKYTDITNKFGGLNDLDKQGIINTLSGDTLKIILGSVFMIIFSYLFIIYLSSILIDVLLFSILGHAIALITRIKLRYSALYNIAAYALTLPIILNLIYFIVNSLIGFEIKYFQVMYMAVTSIYIITAILLIKSDVIKKQMELMKIIEEQDRVREEIKRREEEEKLEAERERQRKEDEEKRKQENKDQEDEKRKTEPKKKKINKPSIGEEPEGNNV